MLFTRLRPTLETPFHIDWGWFERNGIDVTLTRLDQLCYQCRNRFEHDDPTAQVDWVDSTTGEVFQVDAVSEAIMSHCQWKPDYINATTPLTAGIFRALLAHNNRPMKATELAQRLGRSDAETVLRVISGRDLKYGISPVV